MKRISIAALILFVCFVAVAWGQKVTCPASVNWTEFHTQDMRRWNPCETVLGVDSVRSLALLWSYSTGGAVHSSPALADGVVYVGSEGDSLYALNASTGAKLWSYRTGNQVWSSPAVAKGVVYVGSRDSTPRLDVSCGATPPAAMWVLHLP